MLIATIQSTTTTTTTKTDLRVGNLKRSFACKSTQNKKMQAERDGDLYQSKVERPQVRVMNNNTRKTVENAKKTFQDAQSAVHGAREREESTKKRAEADVHAAHVR